MRKFIVYTRALPTVCCKVSTDAPSVVEIDGEVITAMEDPSVMWQPEGEFRFRIFKPEWLHEQQEIKKSDGTREKTMVPPVYCSHSVYWTVDQAYSVAENIIRKNFEFIKRKSGTEFTEEEVRAKFSEIQEILL